jgi:glycosyltransferase involved in cell wall biosynthesis
MSAFAAWQRQPQAQSAPFAESPELTVLLPCLNEADTLPACLSVIYALIDEHGWQAEVIVADNGSHDKSPAIARQYGARVVSIATKGYGNALRGGIAAAQGEYIIVADADMSYDFGEMPRLLEPLRAGYDLVMGNRFLGDIQPFAMPFLNRYVGSPILSTLARVLFDVPYTDFYCGLRGFNRHTAQRWNLARPGAELSSEMVLKAVFSRARITEVPVTLRPDRRTRRVHLRAALDGLRHLALLCTYYFFPPTV